MLKIYNSLARDKQLFEPLEPGKVRMYVCGMTVYDYCHIGHARMMVSFDLVQRWLRTIGYDVTYVRNITDIDDKIIRRAVENGERIGQVTERFIAAMDEDAAKLGVQKPDAEPRATGFISQMLDIIDRLETNGLAYQAADGDVNFSVRKFSGYGKLSGKTLDDLRAGERVSVDSSKHDPLDFVLWKHAKPEEPDEAKWPSRWGIGRPGWHIECSAMSAALLGQPFDIHGGGPDLPFPHHENEIAQSEGAYNKPFVRYWMHNGALTVDNEKMSKSLGNFFTIRDILKHYDAEVLRFFFLRSHYRSPQNYSRDTLDDAKAALTRLYTALKDVPTDAAADAPIDWNEPHAQRFAEAMNDDFNTPIAMAVLFELANEVNKFKSPALAAQLKRLGGTIGLLERDARDYLQGRSATGNVSITPITGTLEVQLGSVTVLATGSTLDEKWINTQIEARATAKKEKDFAKADRIRNELLGHGIILEDSATGTTWRRA